VTRRIIAAVRRLPAARPELTAVLTALRTPHGPADPAVQEPAAL
jgi:hypothetical protein